MSQFTYKRIEKTETGEKEYIDSFNLSKVIRSVEMPEGKRLVLLDDLHTRKEKVPILNKKGELTGYKNEEGTYQSEVLLEKQDADNFIKVVKNLKQFEFC